MIPTMSAPPEYCETVDETIASHSKDEMPPIYVMDVSNLTWHRAFPPTYDDEERQIDEEPMRSIEAEIDREFLFSLFFDHFLLNFPKQV